MFLPEGEVAAKPTEGSLVRGRRSSQSHHQIPLAKHLCSYYVPIMIYRPPPLHLGEMIAPIFTPARVARLAQSLKVTKGNRKTAFHGEVCYLRGGVILH